MTRVLIVGASLAGLRVAEQLRAGGFDGEIDLVGEEPHLPYDRPPLSKQVLLGSWPSTSSHITSHDELAAQNIRISLGVAASAIDRSAKSVRLGDGSVLEYDKLVIATGARARTLGMSHEVMTLRTLDDAIDLSRRLVPGARVAVVGAGFIGCEVAATAQTLGAQVSLVGRATGPLSYLGPTVSDAVRFLHHRAGVKMEFGRRLVDVEKDAGTSRLVFDDGHTIEADVVVAGVGAVPNVEWLRDSGLAGADGIPADASGLTVDPNIYALGDVAAWCDTKGKRLGRSEHWSQAIEQAKVVAQSINGRSPERAAHVAYAWSDQYEKKFQFVGTVGGYGAPLASPEWSDVHSPRFSLTQDHDGLIVGGAFIDMPKQAGLTRKALQRGDGRADRHELLAKLLSIAL